MNKDQLGNRMKGYERVSQAVLTPRMPTIIRVDGKAFHSLTKGMDKPFDEKFKECMMYTTEMMFRNIDGAKLAYVQSDEISILLTDYDNIDTSPWFGKKVQKMCSIASAYATYFFGVKFNELFPKSKKYGIFDARIWTLPKEEVTNYFIWRQKDCNRNSIQGLGQAHFSHKALQKKSCNEIQDMLMLEKQINWNDAHTYFKRGGCVYKNLSVDVIESERVIIDDDIPIFTKDREYVEHLVQLDVGYAGTKHIRYHAKEIVDLANYLFEDVPVPKEAVEKLKNAMVAQRDEDDGMKTLLSPNSEPKFLFTLESLKKYDFELNEETTISEHMTIEVYERDFVIAHFMTTDTHTQPLQVWYNNKIHAYVFGNHSMQQLLEIDSNVKFSIYKSEARDIQEKRNNTIKFEAPSKDDKKSE
tara:strand:+ start:13887 stop:15131 length:1245 start_codon:yes stop_codon:yes gene_type:complete